jgi:1-acyl-sn-glycerol-3-phosphate acyltransferase
MPSFDLEFKRLERRILRLTNILLFPKRIEVRGGENFVKTGPNLIVGNHIGSYKDVGTLLKTVPRHIYFVANKMIFSREEAEALVTRHLHRHLKEFSIFAQVLLKPFYAYAVPFVADNIGRIGTIPVDMYGSRSDAIYKIQDYLRNGRAVIALQGRGRVHPRDRNPYVKRFRRGAAIMAYNLYKDDGISVPVTPLSFFGTHILWGVPNRIRVNVAPPMFIKDYWGGGEPEVVERFRAALEKTVTRLFLDSLKW